MFEIELPGDLGAIDTAGCSCKCRDDGAGMGEGGNCGCCGGGCGA